MTALPFLDPEQPWAKKISPGIAQELHERLTGNGRFDSSVNLSSQDADKLIENLRKDPRGYPQVDQAGGNMVKWGDNLRAYHEWLVAEYLHKEPENVESIEQPQVTVDEIPEPKEEEIETAAELASETVDASISDVDEKVSDEVIEEFPDELRAALAKHINKRVPDAGLDESRKTRGTTNSRILSAMTTQMDAVQKSLGSINDKLEQQNSLLRASFYATSGAISDLESNDNLLIGKLDNILEAFKAQTTAEIEQADLAEDRLSEARSELQKPGAFTQGFKDTDVGDGLLGFLTKGLLRVVTKIFRRAIGKLRKIIIRGLLKALPPGARWRLLRSLVKAKRVKAAAAKKATKIATREIGKRLAAREAAKRVGKEVVEETGAKVAQRTASKVIQQELLPELSQQVIEEVGPKATQEVVEKVVKEKIENAVVKGVVPEVVEELPWHKLVQKLVTTAKGRSLIANKIGKEAAEKLIARSAVKILGTGTVAVGWGAIEGIARGLMGDVDGMFLSFGSAIPVAGWATTALDLMREIDKEAYEKNIGDMVKQGNIIGAGAGFPAWFQDAFGGESSVDELRSYEMGTPYTSAGLAMGHGVELITGADWNPMLAAMSPGASAILGASSTFMNHAPAAASLSSAFKHKQNNLENIFGSSKETATMPGSSGSVSSAATALDKMSGLTQFSNQGAIFEKFKRSLDGKDKDDDKKPTPTKTWDGTTALSNFMNILPQGDPRATSGFGPRNVPNVPNASKDHKGYDIGVNAGSPVIAAEGGTVESVSGFTHGQQVTIRHADGSANLYGHIDPSVKKDDVVARGSELGTVKYWRLKDGTDNTHLHFERFESNAPHTQVDPEKYLEDLNLATTTPGDRNMIDRNLQYAPNRNLLIENSEVDRTTTTPSTGVVSILMGEQSGQVSSNASPSSIGMGNKPKNPVQIIRDQALYMA